MILWSLWKQPPRNQQFDGMMNTKRHIRSKELWRSAQKLSLGLASTVFQSICLSEQSIESRSPKWRTEIYMRKQSGFAASIAFDPEMSSKYYWESHKIAEDSS